MTGTVSFCVGTGRCGTTFISELASLEPRVAASHERLRLPACFHMYCKWHGIEADPEGFLVDRDEVVAQDFENADVSFEASALLSHSILELYERFDARFLLLVRRPDETVGSFAVRGWFLDPIPWRDPSRVPTIREGVEPRHFFGRNLPRGREAFERWTKLPQIGKLAWFYDARIRGILEQLAQLPDTHRHVLRLEDFDHQRYLEIAPFLGWHPQVEPETFQALAASRPNAGANPRRRIDLWSADDVAAFEAELGPLASALGYEHRIEALRGGAPALTKKAPRVEDVLAAL